MHKIARVIEIDDKMKQETNTANFPSDAEIQVEPTPDDIKKQLQSSTYLRNFFINPILTGGGVNLTPPCTKSATASRPPLIATRLFMTFFFQVLRIF